MANDLKRKSPPEPATDGEAPKRRFEEQPSPPAEETASDPPSAAETPEQDTSDASAQKPLDRQARFAALRARQTDSRKANRKETALETQRLSTNQAALTSLQRKRDIASQKLLKADTVAAGEDFERKRAWDWTVEESERWDKRQDKKEKHRQDVAFADYRQDARKVYKRQVREMGDADMDAYEQQKAEAVQRAIDNGGLELVEAEDGELVAIDRDGSFYATADSTEFAKNKPKKENVDRLVQDLKKAEEVRLRKRRERGRNDPDEDVSYINSKNKQFNQKLARFYNKYTAEIRDNFERGTAM